MTASELPRMFGTDMFDWDYSFIVAVAIAVAMAGILRPIWARFVGWHLRIRQHVWVLPSIVLLLVPALLLMYLEYETLANTIWTVGGAILLFFSMVVGAGCPNCGSRLRCRASRYGPVRYSCSNCGFSWTGWALTTEPPD